MIWVRRSLMKMRIRRGPSCCAASVSTTIVIEIASVASVMVAVTRLDRKPGASLASPLYRNQTGSCPTRIEIPVALMAATAASAIIASGRAHRLVRTFSQIVNRRGSMIFLPLNRSVPTNIRIRAISSIESSWAPHCVGAPEEA